MHLINNIHISYIIQNLKFSIVPNCFIINFIHMNILFFDKNKTLSKFDYIYIYIYTSKINIINSN